MNACTASTARTTSTHPVYIIGPAPRENGGGCRTDEPFREPLAFRELLRWTYFFNSISDPTTGIGPTIGFA